MAGYIQYNGNRAPMPRGFSGFHGLGDNTGIGPNGEFGSAQMQAKLTEAQGMLGQLQAAVQTAQSASTSYMPQIKATGVQAAIQQAQAEVGAITPAQTVLASMTSTLNGITVPAATMSNFDATNVGYLQIENTYEPSIQAAIQSLSNMGPQLQSILISAQQAQQQAQAAQAQAAVAGAQAQASALAQAASQQAALAAQPNATSAQQASAVAAATAATAAASVANTVQVQNAALITAGTASAISSSFYAPPQNPIQVQAAQAQAAQAAAQATPPPTLLQQLAPLAPYAALGAGLWYLLRGRKTTSSAPAAGGSA